MVHFADDFGSHVAGSATGVLRVVWFDFSGYPQVSDPEVATIINNQILWFEITVNDLLAVQILEGEDDAGHEKFSLLLSESAPVAEMIAQISAVAVVHDEK